MKFLSRYSLPLTAGLLYAGVFYVSRLHILVFLPPLLLFVFLRRTERREDAIFGSWLFFFVAALLIMRTLNPDPEAWRSVTNLMNSDYVRWVSPFVVMMWVASAAWVSLPWLLVGGVTRHVRFSPLFTPVAFALLWTFAEFLRAKMFFGFTWAHLGYFLFDAVPPLGIYGRFVGVYGLTFLVTLFAGALGYVVAFRKIPKYFWLLLVPLFLLALNGWRLIKAERPQWSVAPLKALVFQGELPWGDFGPFEEVTSGFSMPKSYAALFREAKELGGGDIVVLPEEVLPPIDPEKDLYQWQEELKGIEFVRKSLGAKVFIVGQPLKRGGDLINATLVFEGMEREPKVYAKRRLFPFVEYAPFGERTWGKVFLARPRHFTPGSGAGSGVLSCMEVLFPEVVRAEVKAGASILLSGGSEIAWERPVWEHNLLISRFNTMQSKRFLVRAMKEGYSTIVNPLGEVVAKSSGNRSVLLQGNVMRITQ
ncbi:MAG: hypothetical protein HYS57_01590 [Parcubacteria group bacterium]|nr:hypothetical protein [Parcubacteria group bacterium]